MYGSSVILDVVDISPADGSEWKCSVQ